MTLVEFIFLILVAGICGSIGQALVGFSRGGCIISIAVGFIGALIGSWLGRKFALPEFLVLNIGETAFPVFWSIIGGALFVGIISFLTPRK